MNQDVKVRYPGSLGPSECALGKPPSCVSGRADRHMYVGGLSHNQTSGDVIEHQARAKRLKSSRCPGSDRAFPHNLIIDLCQIWTQSGRPHACCTYSPPLAGSTWPNNELQVPGLKTWLHRLILILFEHVTDAKVWERAKGPDGRLWHGRMVPGHTYA